jgi:hypothetical protein
MVATNQLILFAENANRDTYIDPTTGDQAIVIDAEAVALLAKSRVEAQRGEMRYAANQGMPTFETAFNTFNPKQFEAAARTIILGTTGVTGIQSFTLQKNGNELDYVAVIQTVFGQTATITGTAFK